MSIRSTLRLWDDAQNSYDQGDFTGALQKLDEISGSQRSSKILFNIGTVQLLLNDPEHALANLNLSIEKDVHLALAYYQRATIYYTLGRFSEALKDFEECLTRLRGNKMIDYKQLGLRLKLYSCEVLYNQASTHCKLGDFTKALDKLEAAVSLKVETKHQCIADGIELVNARKTFPLMVVKNECMFFRPAKTKMANLGKKDYLGKAKVVASVDENDKFSGFAGPRLLEAGQVKASSLPNSPLLQRRELNVAKPVPQPRSPQIPRRKHPDSLNTMDDLKKQINVVSNGRLTPVNQTPKGVPSVNQSKSSSQKPAPSVILSDAPSEPPPRPPKNKPAVRPANQAVAKAMNPPGRPLAPPSPVPRKSNMLTVVVDCMGEHTLTVKSNIPLTELEALVEDKLGYERGSLALWFHPENEDPYIIDSGATLRRVCNMSQNGRLNLNGYSKI